MNSSLPLATALPPPAATSHSSHWARASALYLALSVMETQAVGLIFIVFLGQSADASPASSLVLVLAMLSMYGVATLIRDARAGVKPPWLGRILSPTLYISGLAILVGVLIVTNPPLFLPVGSTGTSATQILGILCFSALYARCIFVVEQRPTHPARTYEIALNGLRGSFGLLLIVMLAAAGSGAGALLPALALAVPLFGLSGFLAVALARHLGLSHSHRPQSPQPTDSRRTWQVLWSGVGPGMLALVMMLEYLGYYAFFGQLAAIFGAIWAGINAVVRFLLWSPGWLWKWLTTPRHHPALQGTPTPGKGTPQIGPGQPVTCSPGVVCSPGPGGGGSGGTPLPGGTGTPMPGPGTPGAGSSTPVGHGTGTAQTGGQTPFPGTGTPAGGAGTPSAGQGTSTPSAGPGTQGNGSGTPGYGTGTPGNGSGTPQLSQTGTPIAAGTGTPGNGVGPGTPGFGTGTPGNGGSGAGPGTPGFGTGTPGNGIAHGQPTPTPTPTPTPAASQTVPPHTIHTGPNILLMLLGILLVLLVIALLLLLVLWLRRRSITDAGEVATALAAHKRRRRTRLEGPYLNSVRAYYRTLLEEAARRGGEYARQPAETPGEYAGRLRELLRAAGAKQHASHATEPDVATILDDLTSAYALERYGGAPIPEQRRTRLRSWLPRLLGALSSKKQ